MKSSVKQKQSEVQASVGRVQYRGDRHRKSTVLRSFAKAKQTGVVWQDDLRPGRYWWASSGCCPKCNFPVLVETECDFREGGVKTMKCKNCGSYAVNPHLHGREEKTDLDLCDVCYWRKRADTEGLSEKIKGLLERCDEAVCIARSAGSKLWTAYRRGEVSPRSEYGDLIDISENEDRDEDELTTLIRDIRKITSSENPEKTK